MKPAISVIVCTHNPREEYLQRTLEGLRSQTLDPISWELLLIDNSSKTPVEGRFDVSWHPKGRILLEEELGLTPARLRGIRESKAEILCYADDDNVLAPDYLELALAIGNSRPEIGCWGGESIGEYETPAPPWFKGLEGMLVVRPMDREACWGNAYRYDDNAPCGAGMCVRRSVVERYVRMCEESPLRKTLGRKGASMMSGEDVDLAFTAIDMGMGMGRFKSLRLLHLIPAGRLDPNYLVRLAEGMAESDVYLHYLRIRDRSKFSVKQPRGQMLLFWMKWLKSPPPKRRILLAQARGRNRAYKRLSDLAEE